MSAEVSGDGQKLRAGATIFGNNMPRIISLNDCRLEAYLDGRMLFFIHQDVPGIIGAVGTVFGGHNVNIAQMSVGRQGEKPGGNAIGILNLDSTPPQEALDALLKVGGIEKVKMIELPEAGELPAWLTS
jgi:D-3-phosphoglycerate dehydrogenase